MAKGKFEYWITNEGKLKLEDWARKGLTDEQIAHNMGINRTTLYDWKKKYTDISDALKKGKDIVDIQVENALFKRAIGYPYEERRIEKENGQVVKEIITYKEMPPDATSAIFWLKNRRPNEWREKREVIVDDNTIKESWFEDEDNQEA